MPCILDTINQVRKSQKQYDFRDEIKREKSKSDETKESFPLNLGTYGATVTPLVVLFFGYFCGIVATAEMKNDPRVDGFLLMDNSVTVLVLCILYIGFSVVWGPNLMRNRPAFNTRKFMVAYNLFQVLLCLFMVIEVGIVGWFFDYNFFCQPVDYSYDDKPIRMTKVAWLFFMSKILDFTDTLFFILNKKFSHVSVLHVVHHSIMVMSMWFGIRYTPGGHMTFLGYVNGIVHIIMYTYYLLAALGPAFRPYLWWKKYLTTIQLTQFVLIFLHSAQLFFRECPTVPRGLPVWTCIYAGIFFYLFTDFYRNTYNSASKKKQSLQNNEGKQSLQTKEIYQNGKLPHEGQMNGHIKSSRNLTFRLDSCLSTTSVE